jgi:hypothetical protein
MRGRTVSRITVAAAAAAAMVSGVGGCGLFHSKHEVGECVRTLVSVGGTDIETVDCPADGASLVDNLVDPVYRIAEVLDYDSSCPSRGLFGIQLKHEPDDAVYCLVPVV